MTMRDKIAQVLCETPTGNYGKQADAILAALPDMIPDLVWEGCVAVSPMTRKRYVADWYDAGDLCTALTIDGNYECGEMPMSNLKAAANAHNRAAIMAAFTGGKP
jgi:hypothetical protein